MVKLVLKTVFKFMQLDPGCFNKFCIVGYNGAKGAFDIIFL